MDSRASTAKYAFLDGALLEIFSNINEPDSMYGLDYDEDNMK